MKDRTALALFGVLLITLSVVVVSQYRASQTELVTAKHEYVYQICNDSRLAVSGTQEQECGNAQDRTSTEFLCTERNSLTTNTCWVEDK